MLAGSALSVDIQFATLETIDVSLASATPTIVGTLIAREKINVAESMQRGLESFALESKQLGVMGKDGSFKGACTQLVAKFLVRALDKFAQVAYDPCIELRSLAKWNQVL